MVEPGTGGLGSGWARSMCTQNHFVYSSGLNAVNFKLVILRSSKGSPRYARASP